MNPNTNQPLSTAYLDQIAPTTNSGGAKIHLSKKTVIILGSVLVFVLLIVMSMISSALRGRVSEPQKLAGKFYVINTIVQDTSKNEYIKNSGLRAVSSSLGSTLQTFSNESSDSFAAEKIDMANLDKDKKISAYISEYQTNETATLDSARLNGFYDRTYAIEMAYMLEDLLREMDIVKDSTQSVDMKSAIITAENSLSQLHDKIESFSDTGDTTVKLDDN